MKITKKNCWFVIEILIAVYLIVSSCRIIKNPQEINYTKSVVENVLKKGNLLPENRNPSYFFVYCYSLFHPAFKILFFMVQTNYYPNGLLLLKIRNANFDF